MLIVLVLFITIEMVYSRHKCACAAYVDPVCSTTNETHSNAGCVLCARQVLACHHECPCVTASANATATAVSFDNSNERGFNNKYTKPNHLC
ncbi:Hypothetical predicted protein [Mytilus galloprovincialis]|uniref:Secreted protein n=1 Tax=Mytilus galloprovincialis TaxID=29158 RepID=A0A8B6F9J7_MYTGA|nr:Hypothetical predicted protein [Mytilus galloprovincialis]